MSKINFFRNNHGEIDLTTINPRTRRQVENLVDFVAKNINVEEYGSWDFGAEFDSNGSGAGEALSWSLYGMGRDYHCKKLFCIIKIRHYQKARNSNSPKIRNNYFLIGKNKDDSAYAHPVNSKVVHDIIKREKNVILALQTYIFQHDYKKVKRYGAFSLIPAIKPEECNFPRKDLELLDSMQVSSSDGIHIEHEFLHVLNPVITQPDQPMIKEKGFYRISWGIRETVKKFPLPKWKK